jgi:transcription initiation factor TFIID subunit 11
MIATTGEKQADVPEPPAGPEEDGVVREQRVGPLRPEHIREAYFRYKTGGEGAGAGLQGLWHAQQQSGVERFGNGARGRRIFK